MNKTACILLSLLFFCTTSFAQENGASDFSIETDKEIVAANGDLVSLTIQLQNNSSTPFNGKIVLKTVDGIQMIGQSADAVQMETNAKRFVPVRISISKNVASGNTNMLFALVDDRGNTKAEFTTTLTIQSVRKVQLSAYEPNQLMQNVGDSLTVSAQLTNRGNSKENITVTASFPDLRGGNKVEKKQVLLDAYQDTIITFSKIITKDLLRVERYTVNMAALYSNGELINNVRIGVQNVSGSRTFTDPSMGDPFSSYSSNSIELSGRNLFSQNEAMQLNAKGEYELLDGTLDFNVNGYLYTHGSTRPQITNTYIDYRKNNKGIRLGNISESLEKYVNGRGVKTYFEDKEKGKYFEVGWADKSYNLLGDQYRSESGTGYTAYAKTIVSTRKEGEYEGSVLYDQTPYENSENVIVMNEYSFELMEDVRVGFELGAGVTRLLKADESPIEPSVAIGYKLRGKFGIYSISSSNFLSSGYYPGVRRGVLQLNQRISRPIGKVGVWAGYSLYNYNPSQLDDRFSFFSYSRGNSRFEAGTNFSIARNTRMSITAKQQTDEGVTGYSNMQEKQPTSKMHSLRLTESINWRSRNSEHSVGLSAENGFTKIPFMDGQQFQLRLNANYNYSIFTLNSYYQQGDFTIYEAYRNALDDKESYRFNVSGGVRKDFFGNRLKTNLNVNYNRDSYSGSNWTYSGRVDYAITPQFSSFVNAYAYSYNSSSYSSFNTNVQAGVRYNLPSAQQVAVGKKGDLKLFLYYDNNVNGIYDEGDTPAEDRIVTIGGVSFISNRKGEVEYRKLPYNDYSLKIPSQDWYAVAPSSVTIVSKRTTIEVALQRTGKVSGKLFYKYDARMSEEFAEKYGGLRMWATATNGKKIEALTNANGEFTLFLPVGEYEISVDANSLTKNVYTDFEPQTVKVTADEATEIPAIELKIQQRKIEVKRFGS